MAILVYHFRIYFNIIISISFQYHVIGLVQFEKAQPFVNGGDTTQKNATLTGVTVQHIKRDGTLEAHPSDHVPWLFELKLAMEIKGPWLFRVFFLGDYCILFIGVMSYNFICLSFQQTQRHLSNGKRAWLFAVFFWDYNKWAMDKRDPGCFGGIYGITVSYPVIYGTNYHQQWDKRPSTTVV